MDEDGWITLEVDRTDSPEWSHVPPDVEAICCSQEHASRWWAGPLLTLLLAAVSLSASVRWIASLL